MFVLFLVGAMLGCLVLLVALVRSPYVPRLRRCSSPRSWCSTSSSGMGITGHVAGLAAGAVLAWAVVTGYRPHALPRTARNEDTEAVTTARRSTVAPLLAATATVLCAVATSRSSC